MNILITGGAGYIGSHTCIELLKSGYNLVVVDNLCNSSFESISRIENLTGTKIPFYNIDVRDKKELSKVFERYSIDGVIHFAGLKSVSESVENPIKYYDTNVAGTFSLIEVMLDFGCKNFVFSSSATVYGNPYIVPIKEDFPLSVTNPYGRSKLMVEEFLNDLFIADNSWHIALLRYFNPVGAHKSGLIGEDPRGLPNNLLPFISQTAVGIHEKMFVFGNDYDTPDGTGIRDYIHVMDLASGHIRALEKYISKGGVHTINLGTGIGHSVLEVIHAFETVSAKTIPYDIIDRRPGDVGVCYADPSKANLELDWVANRGLIEMCKDTWRWQSQKLLL